MPKSKFYISHTSSRYAFGYAIMQRPNHWWQRDRKVAHFRSCDKDNALLLCYQLNHDGNMPPISDYFIDYCVQKQFAPTDPEYSYCVCAESKILHGEEEGTEQLLPPPSFIPTRDADEPVPVTEERYHYTSIPIADFIDEDEQYAKLCAEELLEHLRTALADHRAYHDRHNKANT